MNRFLVMLFATFLVGPALLAAGRGHSLDQEVFNAVLAETNLNDDETDSLPSAPMYQVLERGPAGEAHLVAVLFGKSLQQYRMEGTKLTAVDGSLIRLTGRGESIELRSSNRDGQQLLEVSEHLGAHSERHLFRSWQGHFAELASGVPDPNGQQASLLRSSLD